MKEPREILDALIVEADCTMGCCTSDEALTQLDVYYKQKYLRMLRLSGDKLVVLLNKYIISAQGKSLVSNRAIADAIVENTGNLLE